MGGKKEVERPLINRTMRYKAVVAGAGASGFLHAKLVKVEALLADFFTAQLAWALLGRPVGTEGQLLLCPAGPVLPVPASNLCSPW